MPKLQAYKRRMGWGFPWASSQGSDFNLDFHAGFTEEQQRSGNLEYNYRPGNAPRAPTRSARPTRRRRQERSRGDVGR